MDEYQEFRPHFCALSQAASNVSEIVRKRIQEAVVGVLKQQPGVALLGPRQIFPMF